MGLEDYRKRVKAKKEEEEKTSSSKTTSGGLAKYREKQSIGLDTLFTDLSALGTTLQGVYSSWQTPETMANTKTAVENMYNRLTAYQEYENKYVPVTGVDFNTTFDDLGVPFSQRALYTSPVDYAKKTRDLQTASLVNTYKGILDNWDTKAEYYGQYENADAYTKERDALTNLGGMTSSDVEVEMKGITDLEGILKKAKEYESEIQGYENKKNAWEKRSNGLKTDNGYGDKIKQTQAEYDEYLSSVGYGSIEDIENALNSKRIAYTTVGGENITWQSLYDQKKYREESEALYTELSSKDDFEEYSKKGANIENPTYAEAEGGAYIFGWRPGAKDIGNKVEYAFDNQGQILANDMNSNNSAGDMVYTTMTDKERQMYNYYLAQEREGLVKKGTADEYLNSIYGTLKDRYENKWTVAIGEYANEHPVWASALSVGANVFAAPVEYIRDTYNYHKTGELDTNHASELSSTIRSKVSQKVDWEIGEWDAFDFVYNTGMSMADSAVAMATFGGMGGFVQGMSAAAQGTNDALERGLDKKSAFWNGFMSGAFEGIFESLSIGNFKALKEASADGVKAILKNLGKSMLVNASEETLTELANIAYDTIVNGDLSQYETDIRAYMNSGMSESEAKKKVALENGARVLEAGASGAFMGLGFGGVSQASAYSNTKKTGSTIRESGLTGEMLDIAQMTPEESSAYKTYTQYANKGITADNITDAKLGHLYNTARTDALDTINSKKSTTEQVQSANKVWQKLNEVDNKNKAMEKAMAKTEEQKKNVSELAVGEVTEVTSTGNSAQIEGIKVEGDNTTLVTNEGEISVDDMTFNQRDSELVGFAQQIAREQGNDVANVFLAQYDGNTDVEAYANSFNLVTEYTSHNFTEDTILSNKGVLTAEQTKAIYNATVHQQFEAQDKAIQNIVARQSGKTFVKGEFNDSIIDYNSTTTDGSKVNWNSLTSRQKSAVKFARLFSKATGVNIRFIQSKVEGGKRKGENGSYDPDTNTIEIDVYAGIVNAKSVNDSIIPTLSHEITHWAKAKAPAIYEKLRNEVMQTLADNSGVTSKDRIEKELARLKKAHPEVTYTEEDAIDELVAKACEDMLSNSNSIRKMLNKMTAKEQKTFLAKIKETFSNLMEWINDLLAQYKSGSDEAETLREYKYKLQQISKTWDSMVEQAIVSNQALQNEGVIGETLVNGISKDGTTIEGKNALQMSDRTYREGGREFLINWLDGHRGLTEADKQNIIDQTDRIAELMRAIENEEELPDYSNWANMEVVKDENGEKVLSVIVKNGDYAMNIDFSQVCKKRVALNAVLNAMVQSGDLNVYTLTETDVADLNAIIKEHDFEIACALCFVDSKRYRVGAWAESFCEGSTDKKVHKYGFNEMVRSLIPKGSGINVDEFNFTGRDIKNQPTKNLLSDASDYDLDFSLIDEIMANNDPKSAQHRYAKAIKENPEIRKILNSAEIISSIGLDAIRLESPKLYRLINGHQGTAKPKFSHDVVAYGNDILKAKNFTAEAARMVGGVRCQSFSDFMANMVVDYAQFISELSAKQLTSHSYTKEPLFVKLFGLTGMKINMSLVPKAIDMTPEQQEYFAILKDKNANKRSKEYKTKMKEYEKLAENAGLDENGNYIWEDETFPYDIAMELVVDPRYSANCGTIAVGISNKHILKLLADERISMVIPYHKSGLNHEVAMMRDIALYNDYTNVQNTRFADGSKLEGVPDFSFYADLYGVDGKEGTHDPKKTAENYLAWCDENGYIPKFDEFRGNENYYKLLVDFRVYDTDGTYREQQPVKAIYPEDAEFRDLILNGVKDKNGKVYGGLKQQQGATDRLNAESQQIIDEYREVLKDKYGKDVLKKQNSDRASFSTEGMTEADIETAKSVIGNLKTRAVGSRLLPGYATYTEERMNREIKTSSSTDKLDYAKSYITWVNPTDFVYATTTSEEGRKILKEEAGTLDIEKLRGYSQPIHLTVDFETGEIVGHEGRHRMLALQKEGIDEVVVIIDAWNDDRHHTKPIGFMSVKGQRFGEYRKGTDMYLHDMLPLSKRYAEVTKSLFANTPKSGIQFSDRDSEYLSAVERGDMETAQRMVDEAAREAGYDSPKLYHGTKMFGFTKVKTSGVEKGFDWSPFFAANREDISASYVPYGKVRDISSSMDDDAIEEARETAIEERKENIIELVDDFRRLIDRHFSPWVLGQTDNSYLESLVEEANPEAGYEDGVYDVLSEIVYNSFYDYQDEFDAYEDADDWSENSPEGQEIFSKIVEIEGEKSALHNLESGEELGGIYQLYANLDNMYVVDGKGAAWNKLRPEGLPKIERYGVKDVPYSTRDVAEWARENGFDGVIFKNIRDNGAYGRTPMGDVYAFFRPESQIKSADAVTYDDNGNVIPLSQRFDSGKDDIRYSDRDSEGNTLSEEQAEFFKDSKVRDYKGNLLVCYHSTDAEFTIFDKNKIGSGNGGALFGKGFYFATYEDLSSDYGIHTERYYLNIKNPFEYYSVDKDYIINMLEKSGYDYNKDFVESYDYDILYDGDFIDDFLSEALIGKSGYEELSQMVQKAGFDGIWAESEIIAFEPNQIKLTTNTKPTSNPDIRYSDRVSNKELASMDDTALYIKNTKNANYIKMIFNGAKTEETRSQRTLDAFLGKDFYVTDGKYVYGTIVMGEPHKYTEEDFHKRENQLKHRVPKGDEYDIKKGGIKWAYPIESYKKFDKPKKLSDSKEYKNSFQARQVLYSENIRYSDRQQSIPTEELYDLMGENERLKKREQILTEGISRLKERLKMEGKETNGQYFADSTLNKLAEHIKKKYGSTIDSKYLADMLRELTGVIKNLNDSGMTPDVLVKEHLYPVAHAVAEQIKTKDIIDEEANSILKAIRGEKIVVSENQIADLKGIYDLHWNRAFFGKLNVSKGSRSNVDEVYARLREDYPSVFPEAMSDADMLPNILDAYNRLKDAMYIEQEFNVHEALMEIAQEIYSQCWNLKPTKTIADKYADRIKQLNTEHNKAMSEMRKTFKDRADRQKLTDDMYYGRRLQEMRKDKTEAVAKQRLADDMYYSRIINNIRKHDEMALDLAKKQGRERLDKYKENADRKTRLQRITANVLDLSKKLIKNSKDEHIPEIMKPVIVELIQALDFSSKRMLDKGIPTQKDISLYKALERVQQMMLNATNSVEGMHDFAGHGLDDQIAVLVSAAFNTMRDFGDNEFILNNMSLEDLATLDEVVRFIKHVVNAVNKFYVAKHSQGVASLSKESVGEMRELGDGKKFGKKSIVGGAVKMLNWKNINPYYAFKRYGEGGRKIFEALQDGWDKFAFNIKTIIDFTKKVYNDKEVKAWSEKVETFEIIEPATDEERADPDYTPKKIKVRMTTAQIMSLYCLNKREQAKGHLLGGGMRVADFEDGRKTVSQTDAVILTENTIAEIIGKLDERQIEVADKLQKFLGEDCAKWGNEVSMLRFGYNAFGELNYFPIQSDENNLAVNDATDNQSSLFRLLNMSFSKTLTEKANNAIVISNIFDVFAQHSSDMAKYNALALPVLDAFRWYNFVEKQQKGEIEGNVPHKTMSVKEAMEKAFGNDAKVYFTTFLRDINGTQNVSRDTLGSGFFKNAKIASVGLNLRVVLLQPTSYLRASAVIDNRYLTRALMHKPKMADAIKHCGMALWKSLGYYDTNVQRGVEEIIKHNKSAKDKAVEVSMKGAEFADRITWGYLWNACELEIRDKRKDLKVGDPEFFEAVGKRLREVIYATQVVDSTMTRSEMMRSSDRFDKVLTAFASEPTLAYNMLYDAYMDLHLEARKYGNKEAWRKHGKKVARVITAYTVTNMAAALVESGFDAFRDDDEEEKDLAYFMRLYLTNFASDMSITGKIPYIKEIHSILKGYGSSRTDTQWMESLSRFIKEVNKSVYGEGNPSKIAKTFIKVFTDFTGLPIYNVYRDLNAGIDLFTAEDLDEMFNEFFE